jgi:glycolate oxidase FAD binding subunit
MRTIAPVTEGEVSEAVAAAAAEGTRLAVSGGGSKAEVGHSVTAEARLDLAGLDGIVSYEPEELVLSARPATPLRHISEVLAERRQHLAFEPPGADLGATLGGVLAANASGPRRVVTGAARDHFLGAHAVSGRGEAFRSGGRVVKNVTGYDLPKLLAGSWGTLAVLTLVTVKVMPAPDIAATVAVFGLGDSDAVAGMCRAAGTPHEVSGFAHLPAAAAARSSVPQVADAAASVTALRVEGLAASVLQRTEALRALFSSAESVVLDTAATQALWSEIGEVSLLPADGILWRLSVPPANGARAASEIAANLDAAAFLFDWSGARVWAAAAGTVAHAEAVRNAAARAGGHAILVRAPSEVRARVPVFPPQTPTMAALQERVRYGFDPLGLLNPGRMTGPS